MWESDFPIINPVNRALTGRHFVSLVETAIDGHNSGPTSTSEQNGSHLELAAVLLLILSLLIDCKQTNLFSTLRYCRCIAVARLPSFEVMWYV